MEKEYSNNGVIEGLGCEQTAEDMDGDAYGRNVQAVADMIGLDETCVRVADTMASSASSSGGFESSTSASVGPFGMLGRVSHDMGATWQDSQTRMDNSLRESGCGNVLYDTTKIMDHIRNINCQLTQTVSNMSVGSTVSSSVSIRVDPNEEVERRFFETVQSAGNAVVAMAAHPVLAARMADNYARLVQQLERRGDIDIRSSSIRTKAGVGIKTLNEATLEQKSNIEHECDLIATTTAEHVLQKHAGVNALQSSVKQLVETEMTTIKEDFHEEINSMISNTVVESAGDASVEIVAPVSIRLTNATVSSEVMVEIVSTSVASTSVELGKKIATDLLAQAASHTSTSQENAGLEALQVAMGEGNAAAIAAQQTGLSSLGITGSFEALGGIGKMAGVAALVAGGLVLVKMLSGGARPTKGPDGMGGTPLGSGSIGNEIVMPVVTGTMERVVNGGLGVYLLAIASTSMWNRIACKQHAALLTNASMHGAITSIVFAVVLALQRLPLTGMIASIVPWRVALMGLLTGVASGFAGMHSASKGCDRDDDELYWIIGCVVLGIVGGFGWALPLLTTPTRKSIAMKRV